MNIEYEYKRLHVGYLLAALVVLAGIMLINWINAGCAPGNC